jgi:hypothetical protein
MFPRDMVCLRNMSVDTVHKGDTEDDDDDNDDDDDSLQKTAILGTSHIIRKVLQCEA